MTKKLSMRNDFGRNNDQRGKILAEKMNNKETFWQKNLSTRKIQQKNWSTRIFNYFVMEFVVDQFLCRILSSLISFYAKVFPRWSLFQPKSFLINHFFVTTTTRILTFLPFWGLKTTAKNFLSYSYVISGKWFTIYQILLDHWRVPLKKTSYRCKVFNTLYLYTWVSIYPTSKKYFLHVQSIQYFAPRYLGVHISNFKKILLAHAKYSILCT